MRLRFSGITKRFGPLAALDSLSLDLPEFKALAVIGPSGGGKTTLLRVIGGLIAPDEGELEIDGEPVDFAEESLLAHRRRIGTVFQAYNLFPHLSAIDNITLPLVKVHGFAPEAARAEAGTLLDRFHLAPHAGKKPAQLSGGQQQRVALARAIAIRPRFLLLDEPTSALDPEMTAEVLDIITELRQEGRDIIMATHHMGFARSVADQCIFVCDGGIAEAGPAAELFARPRSEKLRNFLAKVLKY
ncbi:amino acid ABC transporter ATP-binding protein [Geobacter sp.]|uniref:amino acid ABC transporter ATP-binding protein n=1 Tax=Geobacter sp. TaxID=46610 RepID=UPI002614E92B|nr:amino acid ABC transporter ATP-binding protein [Geobacter sp.]